MRYRANITTIYILQSDRKSCICHRMAQLRMLYIMILTYIFKVTNFEMWISRRRRELPKNAQVWLLSRLIFAIEWDHCERCTSGSWNTFSSLKSFRWLSRVECSGSGNLAKLVKIGWKMIKNSKNGQMLKSCVLVFDDFMTFLRFFSFVSQWYLINFTYLWAHLHNLKMLFWRFFRVISLIC